MPVLNAFVNCNHVTGMQLPSGLTFFLVPAFPGSYQENLETIMVDVPVVPAAGFKVNVGDIDIDIIIRRNQAIEIACSNKVFRESNIFGILFAVDEVNQGMGRTGKWWSIQHFGIEPDLMSVGKSLASGMPLSAVIGRKEIMESLGAPANVYTTAGNPVTTAAANATLDVIQEEHLLERSAKLGEKAKQFFEGEQKKYDFIGDVRMYGLDGGINIVNPQTGKGDTAATTRIMYRVFELGAIIISLRGNILRFQPPLVITEEELDRAFGMLDQAFAEEAAGKLTLPDNADELGW